MTKTATTEVAELSTAHLPASIAANLNDIPGVMALRMPTGWFMTVPAAADLAASLDTIPAAVLAAQTFARRLGCDYIRFSTETPPMPFLATFDGDNLTADGDDNEQPHPLDAIVSDMRTRYAAGGEL